MDNEKAPIRILERVHIGNDFQWVLVRGNDRSLPVLLVVQAGPGFPLIHEADSLQRDLGWEDEFRVVYWDMRGCGKSAHPNVSFGARPLERLALDIREMISFLLERLEAESLFLLGFSLGASLSILSAHRSPEGIRALVGVGPDVCIPESDLALQDFLDGEAVRRNHLRALKDLKRIGDPPYLNSSSFMIRAKWATEFGGIHRKERYGALLRKNLYRLFSSSDYSLKEAIRALGAIASVQEALLPEMKDLDLFRQAPFLKVPVFLFQGRYDAVAPSVLTQRYFDLLEAPHGKNLLWFVSSAHMPHFEEPNRFAGILKEVRIRTEEGKSLVPEVIDR